VYINNVTSPTGYLSFPHIAKPDSEGEYADDKYKATLLFDKKGVDLSGLKKAALLCAQKAFGAKITSLDDFEHPFRDGDAKDKLKGYAGRIYITPKRKSDKGPPKLVGKLKEQCDASLFYGGCKVRAILTAMSYVMKGKPSVTFLLEALQFAGDGERFGGGGADIGKFDDITDEGDDPADYAEKKEEAAPAPKKSSLFD
jgi:hypothetical protein